MKNKVERAVWEKWRMSKGPINYLHWSDSLHAHRLFQAWVEVQRIQILLKEAIFFTVVLLSMVECTVLKDMGPYRH